MLTARSRVLLGIWTLGTWDLQRPARGGDRTRTGVAPHRILSTWGDLAVVNVDRRQIRNQVEVETDALGQHGGHESRQALDLMELQAFRGMVSICSSRKSIAIRRATGIPSSNTSYGTRRRT